MTKQANTNPFPGLRPFLEKEQYLFFGRESQVDAMVDKLAETRFLSVVGTSGSGKSSLVNCGLQPALRSGLMASAGTHWRFAKMRPGSDPIAALSQALAENGVLFSDYPDSVLSLDEIIDVTLHISKLGLIDIIKQAKLDEGVNLLLVVDQFEELFRYAHLESGPAIFSKNNEEQATEFVNLLLAAIAETSLPIYIVLTMRSDFLGDCSHFAGLAEAINTGQYLVPRLTRDQRRAAIQGPVGVKGASIEPVLLTRLVNDVGDNPDQLSILQHALNRTWFYWENEAAGVGPLSLHHYEAIGSMQRALDQHAEKAYTELAEKEQKRLCAKLFKALTDKATDPRGTRRPTTLGNLCALAGVSEAEVCRVIDVFRQPNRSFLMPPANVKLDTHTVIDISHESLMRVWRRLDKWANQEALAAQMYRRLGETAALFEKRKADLLSGPELRMALDWQQRNKPNQIWAERYNPAFSDAMAFLQKSEDADTARRTLKIEAEATSRRRKLAFLGAIVATLVVVSGYSVISASRAVEAKNGYENAKVVLADLYLKANEKSEDLEKAKVALVNMYTKTEDSKKEFDMSRVALVELYKEAAQSRMGFENAKVAVDELYKKTEVSTQNAINELATARAEILVLEEKLKTQAEANSRAIEKRKQYFEQQLKEKNQVIDSLRLHAADENY